VVTTDAGGIPDIVTCGETGFVVAVDDHQGLAQSAMKLLSDCNTAARITAQARQECRKYTWEVVGNRWLCLYRKLFEKKS
jgi:glycosyltransferase involved in cell wall biosynthesis